jgi:hypothetical protein
MINVMSNNIISPYRGKSLTIDKTLLQPSVLVPEVNKIFVAPAYPIEMFSVYGT